MNKTVRFRITSHHYERLKNIVYAKGFSNVSEFLRHTVFEKDLLFDKKFDDLCSEIIKLSHDISYLKNKMSKEYEEKKRKEYLI